MVLGGVLGDHWRLAHPTGRLRLGMLIALGMIPIGIAFLVTENTTLAYVLNFPLSVVNSMWIGLGASTITELVLPRMRALASAAFLLTLTFIGLALGPYGIGYLSVQTGSLRTAMLLGFGANVVAFVCLFLGARHLVADEASVAERAETAAAADGLG